MDNFPRSADGHRIEGVDVQSDQVARTKGVGSERPRDCDQGNEVAPVGQESLSVSSLWPLMLEHFLCFLEDFGYDDP
jgi:hypothetical protein